MFKDLLYTGIGAGLLMKEKMEEEMKKMEKSGKMKDHHSKSCMDSEKMKNHHTKSCMESIEKKAKKEEHKNKEKLRSMMKEIIDDLGIATKDDLEKLKQELK
jgi:polyhydroxyalkanoate synthesis regulator phasin